MKKTYRQLGAFLIDIFLINLSIIAAYYLRIGKDMPIIYLQVYLQMMPFVTVAKILVFYYMGLYRPLWKYANIDELIHLFFTTAVANGLIIIGIFMLKLNVPRSIYVIATLLDMLFIGSSRFIKQIYNRIPFQDLNWSKKPMKRVMIIGAGEAGGLLIQEFKNHPSHNKTAICIIDDNEYKIGRRINGIPVVGKKEDIPHYAEKNKIDEIIIAIPSIGRKQLSRIIEQCKKTRCEMKILPSIHEIHDINGEIKNVLIKKMRDVDIEDLLGRTPISLNVDEVSSYLCGQTVLITGAGSIGAELCRQVIRFNPKELIIVDISEENLYNIINELRYKKLDISIKSVIANIRESEKVQDIFNTYEPSIVFHTAAHKHVPLMEENPQEAIKNNIFGTWNVVQAANQTQAKRFILISSDKAVNPTNVMGATKRFCEMMVQAVNKTSKTEYVAVRFGNVLGSSGSVIPVFKKQIQRGEPVTVTHPEIIRYFMTIPEAVQLVIQAGALANGGEIFVLDMGEPVKIDQLARDLIRLSGLEPEIDIPIEYTGLRPGEKLFEELLMAEEGISDTRYEKIHIAKPMDISMEELNIKLDALKSFCNNSEKDVKKVLQDIVPTYFPVE